jgi:hypothetical protein
MMGFRRSDLQEAFFVPGTHAFRVFGYGTADPLDLVLAPGYFATAGGLLRPGDLIYVSAGTASQRSQTGADHGEARMALLMVLAGARGAVAVRLAQDFGRTDDADPAKLPDAALPVAAAPPAMPARRGRGRPPGSRNRKNGALAATALN